MDDSIVLSQVIDLHGLLNRVCYTLRGSSVFVDSTLGTATSALASTLEDVTELLKTTDGIEQQYHAAQCLSEVLDRSIPILESHLEVLERGRTNSHRGCSQTSWTQCCEHSREEQRTYRTIQRTTTKILFVSSMPETPSSNSPRTADSEDDAFHNQDWSNERDSTPPRGRHRHRASHDQHVQSQDGQSEQPWSSRTESPVPLTADEEPMVIPANVRGGRFVDVADDDQNISSGEEIHTDDSEDDILGRFSPSYPLSISPPPRYTPRHNRSDVEDNDLHVDREEWDLDTPSTTAQAAESADSWVNPIIAGCRDVIRIEFLTAYPSVIDEYDQYRGQIRRSPEYKWYLNFRYMSLILQLDLPFQVFLITLATYVSGSENSFDALACVFEDCIVFAVSPFRTHLPDLDITLTDEEADDLHRGLRVMEDWPIRFEKILSIREESINQLVIEMPTIVDDAADGTEVPTGRVQHVLIFDRNYQRDEVLETILHWMRRDDPIERDPTEQDHQSDTRSQPHHSGASAFSYSSSSSSRSSSTERTYRDFLESRERRAQQNPSHSRVQDQDTASDYTYHSRSSDRPSRESHNHTTAITPRSALVSRNNHAQARNTPQTRGTSSLTERELRIGISRNRSPLGVEVWMIKNRKKRWFWPRQPRNNPVASGSGRQTEE